MRQGERNKTKGMQDDTGGREVMRRKKDEARWKRKQRKLRIRRRRGEGRGK